MMKCLPIGAFGLGTADRDKDFTLKLNAKMQGRKDKNKNSSNHSKIG